jgi:PST family polysaccharide transporter
MIADNVAYFISMACIGTALALLDWGVWALVVAQLALKVVRACILGYFVRPMPRGDWSYSSGVRLMWMGFGFSLGRLLNFFSLQGDNFVVGRLLGVEALGMYNRAYQLMTLPAMYVGQVIERVMFPLMAQKQHSRARLVQDFLLTLEAITIVSLPVGVVMYYLAEEIIVVGFGQQWRAVVPVVSILSFGVFFRTAYKCSDTVVRSVGAVYHYAARQAMYTGLVVTGSFAGAWYAGLEGVAVGVVVAVGLNYVSMTRLSSVTIGTPFIEIVRAHYSGLWVAVCVAIGMGVAVPQLRASCDSPVIVLGLGCVLAVSLWLCSVVVATRIFPQGILEKMTRLIRDYQPLFGIGSRQAR